MRIGFVCDWDAADPHAASGAAFSMRRAIMEMGHIVVDIFPVRRRPAARAARFVGGIMTRAYARQGLFYSSEREAAYRSLTAAIVRNRLRRLPPVDAIFSQSAVPITRLRTKAPIYLASDQSFAAAVRDYIERPAPRFVAQGMDQTEECLQNVRALFVPSEWAAREFVELHGARADRIAIVPWGANLVHIPDRSRVEAAARKRMEAWSRRSLDLLFIGKDWYRKGGEVVADTFGVLKAMGIDVRLTVVGIRDPQSISVPHRHIPFLNKHDAVEGRQLADLFLGSHYFFMPSRAEAYAHVYCEAAAHGVPSVAADVGGISSLVRDEITGFCLPKESSGSDYAERIVAGLARPDEYLAMSTRARDDYEGRLNWGTFAAQVVGRIEADLRQTP